MVKRLHSWCVFLEPSCTFRKFHRKRSSGRHWVLFPVVKRLQQNHNVEDQPTMRKCAMISQLQGATKMLSQEPRLSGSPKNEQGSCKEFGICMTNLPEYHRSVSYESWGLTCLLANSPSSSFLHTYLPCSNSMQLDKSNPKHLHNRSVFQWEGVPLVCGQIINNDIFKLLEWYSQTNKSLQQEHRPVLHSPVWTFVP